MLALSSEQREAIAQTEFTLLADLRFEYLDGQISGSAHDVVWQFVGRCLADRRSDHVRPFMEEYGREPVETICFLPVEHLNLQIEAEIAGARMLPVDDPRIPRDERGLSLDQPTECVIAIPVRGTHYGHMAERARAHGGHALRCLRIALFDKVDPHQRRFALGRTYSFSDGLSGWQAASDEPWRLVMGAARIDEALNAAASAMPLSPTTDIEKRADRAAKWFERALLTAEPIEAMMFLFFALEALLGDTSEGLKAHALAFRQMMLGHIVSGGFAHPDETWWLYDEVRSKAVHGEAVEDVSAQDVARFTTTVRDTLDEYLDLARSNRFTKRSRLISHLEEHADRHEAIAWLREHGGDMWPAYLYKPSRIEPVRHGWCSV